MKKQQHSIRDLFFFSWKELSVKEMANAIIAKQYLDQVKDREDHTWGHYAILLLRSLRKNKALVSKIDVAQAVDCVNNILEQVSDPGNPQYYISEPWYFFPPVTGEFFEAPAERMMNRSFNQLVYADALFTKYLVQEYADRRAHPSQDPSPMAEAYLDDLIAVLYTPADRFDERNIEQDAKLLRLTDPQKIVILNTYANVKAYLVRHRCPNLFDQNDDEKETPVITEPTYSGEMWQSLLFDLSETPAFPGLEKAKSANMYDALDYLEDRFIKARNFKPQMQNEKV
jgi:hypothetical protein